MVAIAHSFPSGPDNGTGTGLRLSPDGMVVAGHCQVGNEVELAPVHRLKTREGAPGAGAFERPAVADSSWLEVSAPRCGVRDAGGNRAAAAASTPTQ